MFRGSGKYLLIAAICTVLCLVVSVVVTIKLSSRMDEADKKLHETAISSEKSLQPVVAGDAIQVDNTVSEEMDYTTEAILSSSTNAVNNTGDTVANEASDDSGLNNISETADQASANDAGYEADASEESDYASINDAEIVKNGKTVYLTFDDGPSQHTEELLDILDRYNVKATFFVVAGDYKYSKELSDIAERGHTIGLHSKSHVYSELYADLDAFKADVEGVHDWVESVTGIDSKYYRFPGGSTNNVSQVPMSDCIAYLDSEGYEYYDWNALSKDAENYYLTADQLTENALYYIRANEGDSIVLLHDLDEHYTTIESLPGLIETLIREGYTLKAIDDDTTPVHHYIEH